MLWEIFFCGKKADKKMDGAKYLYTGNLLVATKHLETNKLRKDRIYQARYRYNDYMSMYVMALPAVLHTQLCRERATADGLTLAPAATDGLTLTPAAAEGLTLAPAATDGLTLALTAAEGLTLASATADGLTLAPAATDGLTLAPAAAEGLTLAPAATDGLTLALAAAEGLTLAPAAADGLTLAPAAADRLTLAPAAAEGLTLAPAAADGLTLAMSAVVLIASLVAAVLPTWEFFFLLRIKSVNVPYKGGARTTSGDFVRSQSAILVNWNSARAEGDDVSRGHDNAQVHRLRNEFPQLLFLLP
uniref:Uncharacterized protein n=1 Tax=Cyprinodon variegatus TaxID=28743 RepID=A0A3Q2CMM8_CYPVA